MRDPPGAHGLPCPHCDRAILPGDVDPEGFDVLYALASLTDAQREVVDVVARREFEAGRARQRWLPEILEIPEWLKRDLVALAFAGGAIAIAVLVGLLLRT